MPAISLEKEIAEYLRQHGYRFHDNRQHNYRLDFVIKVDGINWFHLEAKEKRQAIDTWRWPALPGVKEPDLFILDDLSARKILRRAPYSGLVVRDNLRSHYIFYDVVTLMFMPRLRVNRALDREGTVLKGKWLLDQRNGVICISLDKVFEQITEYLKNQDEIFKGESACYGDFYGELIGVGGRERTEEDKMKDYLETR